MTTNTELIARLRAPNGSLGNEAADAIEALETEVERLKDESHQDGLLRVRYGNELDNLRAQLAAAQQDRDEWKESTELANVRFKNAEAQLAAALGQKPVMHVILDNVKTPLYAAPIPQQVAEPSYAAIHMEHCFQPPYETSCKYGESDCPAQQAQVNSDAETEAIKRFGHTERAEAFVAGWAAAKQAQPEQFDHEPENEPHVSLASQQAQPERAPLSGDTIAELARRMGATDCEGSFWVEFARAIEAAIKQGGRHD